MTVTTIPTRTRTTRLGRNLTGINNFEDALNKAGLNWGLHVVPADNMTLLTNNGLITTNIPGKRLILRDDTYATMGVVGGRYREVDNQNAFSITKHLLDQGAVYREGGERDHGRVVFMRMDLPGCNVPLLNGSDLISAAALIRASHDGSGKIVARIEMTRLACTNGMTTKIPNVGYEFEFTHTASVTDRLQEAKHLMQGAVQYAKAFTAACDHMLDTPMSVKEFTQFIDGMFVRPDMNVTDSTRSLTIWENRRAALLNLFQFADTNELGRNTQMGAFNAITEWVDWGMHVRSASDASESEVRAVRRFDNTGQGVKDQAMALLGR